MPSGGDAAPAKGVLAAERAAAMTRAMPEQDGSARMIAPARGGGGAVGEGVEQHVSPIQQAERPRARQQPAAAGDEGAGPGGQDQQARAAGRARGQVRYPGCGAAERMQSGRRARAERGPAGPPVITRPAGPPCGARGGTGTPR